MDDPLRLPDDLVAWIGAVAGGAVVSLDRKPGGGRKEAWFVDVEVDSTKERRELFLRYDRSDPSRTGDPWTLRREATVYLALQGTEVRVPTVVAVHPQHQAMVTERLQGENWFSRIADADEELGTARDFMHRLAALHRLDARTLELPGFPDASTPVPDLVRHELDEWEGVLAFRGGAVDPVLRLTLDWLRANVPAFEGPAVLVQGDTGPGNFIYAGGRVVAVVDWELAHLGDPMDDIAWLSLRATQEPFTHLPDRLREYEELSGNRIDEERVRYYRVMAEAKLQVMTHRRAESEAEAGLEGGDLGNRLIYGILHRRLWFEALGEVAGFELTPVETPPPHPPSEHDRLYASLLAQLRDVVVPRITDPLALARTKGFARVLKYLAAVNADGPFFDACELDDLAKLLGEPVDRLEDGRGRAADAVLAGRLDPAEYLGYAWRRVARDNELLRPASGVLADRHWPPLS
ncbi:MAG TPA: phosphotransferase family protein [Acidimicrobiia bacterium]|nr:phosphotransferase family protein [Acidimicrobiia bacterium]